MILKINGIDIVPYISRQGVKWQRSDIDASNSGRTLDATMQRGRVASKVRLDVTCRPLTSREASVVLKLILPEFVTVEYTDPMDAATLTKTMYSNNTPASYLMQRKDGTEWWEGITFPLIER